jgi:hypothetical protein
MKRLVGPLLIKQKECTYSGLSNSCRPTRFIYKSDFIVKMLMKKNQKMTAMPRLM